MHFKKVDVRQRIQDTIDSTLNTDGPTFPLPNPENQAPPLAICLPNHMLLCNNFSLCNFLRLPSPINDIHPTTADKPHPFTFTLNQTDTLQQRRELCPQYRRLR